MTATEILRRLLDERGVEWRVGDYPTTCTVWESDGIVWHGLWRDGCIELIAWQVTPAQAIDVTLGRGTCKLDFTAYTKGGVDFAGFRCDGCGFTQAVPSGDLWGVTRFWSYCPNCGKRVVE